MTSTQSESATTPAQNTTAAPSAPSYASAAGAAKKPASTPLVVTGADPASVAGPSVAPSQNASSSVNGRQSIPPAVPTIANGTSSLNGTVPDHNRNGSVSITAPGSGFATAAPGIQFGYDKTPQPSAAVPILAGKVPTPTQSPAPIPRPSASGGKPGATESQFKIGSFPNDGDRMAAMRGNNPTSMSFNDHSRRGSNVSASYNGEIAPHGGPPGPTRGGFSGGRGGRGAFNPQFNHPQASGYPPTNNYGRGGPYGNQSRGGPQPGSYRGGSMHGPFPSNSPRMSHGSPHMGNAVPGHGGTPTMPPAMAVPQAAGGGQYPAPMSQYQYQQNFNQYPPSNQFQPPYMGMPNYSTPMYSSPPGPHQGYYAPPFQTPGPQAQSMSRGNSQMSEQRPASSTGPQGPLSASGAPPPSKGPAIASGSPASQFLRPKQNKKITIKNDKGEEIDLKALKTPASPAPSAQQAKTPPVVATTPTPPPKAPTPNPHARNESSANPSDIKAAFAAQVLERKNADAPKSEDQGESFKADEKAALDDPVNEDERKQEQERAEAEHKAAEVKAAEVKAAEVKAAEDKAAEDKAAEEAEKKAKSEAKAAETKATEQAEQKARADADEKAKATPEPKAEQSEPAFVGMLPGETEDEYFDRMDAEDARREAEQAEITAKKNAEKAAAKKAADSETSEEKDRKLREQEKEMERLEEEKEKAREQREKNGGETQSVADLLASKISGLTASQKKETAASGDKLSKLTINSSLQAPVPGSAPSSAKSTGSKDRRPAALNLAPLKTGSVEAPPQSAAMQALKSSRFLTIKDEIKYPAGIASPNPSINATAAKKGGSFKYDSTFLLQFQKVFTEQPSTEFSQQVKALIGDSGGDRSASTRGSRGLDTRSSSKNAGGGGSFGSFTQPVGGKTLPSGTTSQERFAMSQGQMARPAVGGPMASFGRGAFPGGSQVGRTPSGIGMGSRSGSTRNNQTRGNSKQGKTFDTSGKDARNMPLTAGMDLKPIQVSSTGWKPMSLSRNAQQPTLGVDLLDPATVQRKVKSNLNKMTPENFDKISGQILAIAAQSKDEQDGRTLRQVIQLTFEKATDEAHWAAMYAKFCQCMLENMSPEVKDVTITDKSGNVVSGGALFRKYLLNRCQEDFERGWNTDMPVPKEGESKEAALMSDEYYKAMAIKRRGLGLIQFIGELFRLGMLTERIMHECVRKLLDFSGEPDEAEIESLTKLLRTIGADLESKEKGSGMMNAYFQRIQSLVDSPGLPSRLQFMLMDIIDLRKAKWVSKDGLKGPKTREEIRADAEAQAAAKAAEQSRSNNNRGYQGQGQGRFNSGRGDSRGGHGGFPPPASNNVAMDDLRRLKGSASRAASGNVTLGPSSMFNSRSNSGRKMGPGGSLTRGADDSGGSSRTGTPGPAASSNTFAALAAMNNEDGPASPPSAAASPALNHAKPDKSAN